VARGDGPAGGGPLQAHQLDPARLGDHIDRLYRAAWALCGSREDAEDLVQDTYVRVLARPRFLRNEDEIGYLVGALRNTFLSRKRGERSRPRVTATVEDLELAEPRTATDPPAALEAREVYAAISELPSDYRDVLAAVDVAGLSYEETAKALRIPAGTVMSRLYRARRQVVRALGDA
jgi:RNA polymerase sigma-70 factor (ECF subfamily)